MSQMNTFTFIIYIYIAICLHMYNTNIIKHTQSRCLFSAELRTSFSIISVRQHGIPKRWIQLCYVFQPFLPSMILFSESSQMATTPHCCLKVYLLPYCPEAHWKCGIEAISQDLIFKIYRIYMFTLECSNHWCANLATYSKSKFLFLFANFCLSSGPDSIIMPVTLNKVIWLA